MATDRTSRQPELLVPLDRQSSVPLHIQIESFLRSSIRSGRLRQGSAVPSTRALARDLDLSRGVVVEAYAQLVAEGHLSARQGAQTVVGSGAIDPVSTHFANDQSPPKIDFRPGLPELRLFPRQEWARAVRHVLRDLKSDRLGYPDPAGTVELRTALTQYLCRVRGLELDASRVVVCNGCVQALQIAARTLAIRGIRRVAVEDPGHPDVRKLMTYAGLEAIPVPVDQKGIIVSALGRAGVGAAVLTPAHQFPSGHVLDPDRRRELIAWADEVDAMIIEDDYDAEFRYDRHPVGALQGLSPNRVLYASSVSKTLAPALRLGWLVVPKDLCNTAIDVKKYQDLGAPVLDQLTYVEMLDRGAVDRHLRRMRSVYRSRRDALLVAINSILPGWEPQGAAAGLHLLVNLPHGLSEATVLDAAERHSVRVYPSSSYRIHTGPDGLVLGFASLDEGEIAQGITILAGGLGL